MRKIQIIYLPGLGGNFLRSLFSLSPEVQPCISLNGTADTVANRIDCYLSRTQNQKIRHWGDLVLKDPLVVDSNYSTCIDSIHPHQFLLSGQFDNDRFLIELSWSNFANYWLIRSKENFVNCNYLIPDLEEIHKQIKIRKKYNPLTISLDPFLDQSTWQDEYVRVSELMGLPYYDEAEKLYQIWYDARVAKIKDLFAQCDSATRIAVCRTRLQEYVYGAPTKWNTFYENVRDPSWPDCRVESDFELLPTHIKNELIEKFNYDPLTGKN